MELFAMATTQALPSSSHIVDDEDTLFAARAPSLRPSLARRVLDALIESQMRRAEREVDRILGPGALHRAFSAELPPER
jgi:hypothetical protein